MPTLPYDPTLILDLFPNSSLRQQIGSSPALDPNSTTKGLWLAGLMGLGPNDSSGTYDGTPNALFPGTTSMDYNATVFDDEAGATVGVTINRSTGSSWPTGQTFDMPSIAKGIDEGAGSNNDSHCCVINWSDNVVLQMRQFYGATSAGSFNAAATMTNGGTYGCYSGGGSPINGEAAIWDVAPSNWTSSGSGSPGSGANGSPGTGSGINYADGIVYPEEFEYFLSTGQVLSGMRVVLPTSRISTGTVPPANKTDGAATPSSQTMKEGQRFMLVTTPTEIGNITDNTGSKTSRIARWGQFIAWKLYLYGGRIEDRTTGGFHFSAVHRKSWEMFSGGVNKWGTVFSGAAATPAAAMLLVRMFPTTFAVLSEAYTAAPPPASNILPVASFSVSPTQEIETGATITLTSTSYDPDGVISAIAWDTDNDGNFDNGTSSPKTLSFGTPGTKTVRLRVTDDDGGQTIATTQIVVADTPAANELPVAAFSVAPSSPVVGELVVCTSTSTDPDGTIAAHAWDLDNDGSFDDGTGSTASTTFSTTGTKTIRLRVTDNDGGQNITTRQVVVQDAASVTLPSAPSGFTVAINASDPLKVDLTVDVPHDDRRESTLVLRRGADHSTDAWNSSPAYTGLWSWGSDGTGSGSTLPGSPFDVRPGADEMKLVRVRIPTAGTYPLRAYIGGGGSGGSGTATVKAIGFAMGADQLPDTQSRIFLGSQVSVAYADAMGWVTVHNATFPSSGDYWVGLIVGGSTRAARIGRSATSNFTDGFGGERYVDSGITYASAPTTCPATSLASQRASIYVLTEPGGRRLGGRLTKTVSVPSVGDYYITAYTSLAGTANGDGTYSYVTNLLDATPYPLEVTGSAPPVTPPVDPGPDPETPAAGSLLEGIDSAIASLESVLSEKKAGITAARVANDRVLLDLSASETQFASQAIREMVRARDLAGRL